MLAMIKIKQEIFCKHLMHWSWNFSMYFEIFQWVKMSFCKIAFYHLEMIFRPCYIFIFFTLWKIPHFLFLLLKASLLREGKNYNSRPGLYSKMITSNLTLSKLTFWLKLWKRPAFLAFHHFKKICEVFCGTWCMRFKEHNCNVQYIWVKMLSKFWTNLFLCGFTEIENKKWKFHSTPTVLPKLVLVTLMSQ